MPTQGDAPGSGVKDSVSAPRAPAPLLTPSCPPQRKPRTEQTVLPVTIKQLMEAQNQDETWKIDGQELSHVSISESVPGCGLMGACAGAPRRSGHSRHAGAVDDEVHH